MELRIDPAADQSILAALRENRYRQAATFMVRYYGNAVLTLCHEAAEDPEAAEDLAQESFTRAFQSLSSLRGDTPVRRWLLNIAARRCEERLPNDPMLALGTLVESAERAIGSGEVRQASESLRRRLEVLASSL
jgi:DNA-directed RNA polymerase specialized sigma24 family protein